MGVVEVQVALNPKPQKQTVARIGSCSKTRRGCSAAIIFNIF